MYNGPQYPKDTLCISLEEKTPFPNVNRPPGSFLVDKSVNINPSGQHTMVYPFMNCLNGQQLWHFAVISLYLCVILQAPNVAANLYTTLHCVGFTIKDESLAKKCLKTFVMRHYCYSDVHNRMRQTTDSHQT